MQNKLEGQKGNYGIGSILGEEWMFKREFIMRTESVYAKVNSCVLEFSDKSLE
jgi:hypothetical protein